MASTRKLIAEFIGVFLIGAMAGSILTWSVSDKQLTTVMNHWNNPDELVTRINAKYAKDYNLSPDEVEKIQPLTKQLALDLYKVRHQFGVDIINTLDQDHTLIAAQMTPEHRAAYEADIAERKAKLQALLLGDQSSPTPQQK
jgi:hypothetical protein